MITIEPGERVDRVVHRHWFVLFCELAVLVFAWALPLALWQYATHELGATPAELFSIPPPFIIFAVALWTLVIWMRVFASWMDYFLDEWIITDKRIVDVEQKGFFSREVSSFRMERIQDVTIDISGVLPTLLDFGDLHVQTAGESQQFILKSVGRPKHIKELILRNHDAVVEKTA